MLLKISLLSTIFLSIDAQALPLSNGFAPAVIKGETAVLSQYAHFDFVRNRDAPNFYPLDFVGTTDVVALGAIYSISPDWVIYAFYPWVQNSS